MDQGYHSAQRDWQDRFDTRRLADRLAEGSSDRISDAHGAFIEARDMFFIATADANGAPQCSFKGGQPGFVRVLDPAHIGFPVYDGNGMFLTAGNLSVNPQVGILFIDFETGTRLRVNGTASIGLDDPLVGRYPGAQFVVRVKVVSMFANCRRYVHRYQRVESSVFVPTGESDPPVPDWKRHEWFDGCLPADDPAHDSSNPSAPSVPQF